MSKDVLPQLNFVVCKKCKRLWSFDQENFYVYKFEEKRVKLLEKDIEILAAEIVKDLNLQMN